MRRLFALLIIAVTLAVPTTASAHTSTVTANCENGITISLSNFNTHAHNTVTIVLDGVGHEILFAASFNMHIPNPNKAVSHGYTVAVNQGDGNQFDQLFQGVIQPCVTDPTTTTVTTTTPPTSSTVSAPTPTAQPTTTTTSNPIPSSTTSSPTTTPTSPSGTTTTIPNPTPTPTTTPMSISTPTTSGNGTSLAPQTTTSLPVTGASSTTIWYLGAVALVSGWVAVIVSRRKKAGKK